MSDKDPGNSPPEELTEEIGDDEANEIADLLRKEFGEGDSGDGSSSN